MSNKVFLGTIALAGGVYLYDQNVQQIIPRQKQIKHDLDKVDRKQQDLSKKISHKIEEGKRELAKKPSLKEQIKDTTLYQKVAANAEEYKDALDEATTPDSEKNVLVRGVDKYIDLVNSIGDANKTTTPYSTMSGQVEVKEKPWFGGWFGTREDKIERTRKDAEAKKDEWFSWGSKKSNEAKKEYGKAKNEAEDKKDEWFSWGSKKSNEASKEYEKTKKDAESKANEWSKWGSQKADKAANEAEAKKDEWVNWGSKKSDEVSKDLNKKYDQGTDELNKQLAKLQDNYEQSKNQLASKYEEEKNRAISTYEAAKANLDDLSSNFMKSTDTDKDVKLQRAKEHFNSSMANLRSYGDEVVDDINQRLSNTFGRR